MNTYKRTCLGLGDPCVCQPGMAAEVLPCVILCSCLASPRAGTKVKVEGRLDDGIALYERALSYAPRHADALYNLGVAYGEKGMLQVRASCTAVHRCGAASAKMAAVPESVLVVAACCSVLSVCGRRLGGARSSQLWVARTRRELCALALLPAAARSSAAPSGGPTTYLPLWLCDCRARPPPPPMLPSCCLPPPSVRP